jgi:hypothetical protein
MHSSAFVDTANTGAEIPAVQVVLKDSSEVMQGSKQSSAATEAHFFSCLL